MQDSNLGEFLPSEGKGNWYFQKISYCEIPVGIRFYPFPTITGDNSVEQMQNFPRHENMGSQSTDELETNITNH